MPSEAGLGKGPRFTRAVIQFGKIGFSLWGLLNKQTSAAEAGYARNSDGTSELRALPVCFDIDVRSFGRACPRELALAAQTRRPRHAVRGGL